MLQEISTPVHALQQQQLNERIRANFHAYYDNLESPAARYMQPIHEGSPLAEPKELIDPPQCETLRSYASVNQLASIQTSFANFLRSRAQNSVTPS